MADIFGTDLNDILNGTTDPDFITGGAGDDVIDGNFGSDIIEGGSGNDELLGAPGNDTLTGGSGNDILTGGNGNDLLNGTDSTAVGSGEIDTLTGSGGTDTYILGDANQAYYVAAGAADYAVITDFNPLQETIQLKGIPADYSLVQAGNDVELYFNGELIAILQNQTTTALDLDSNTFRYVGSGLDLVGTPGDDLLEGGPGFDTIQGGDGNDTIIGGDGRDTLNGDAGNDTISGDGGNDTINGGDGNDVIDGGDGNDTIDAGFNDDIVTGGAGDDVINAAPGFDVVMGGAGNDTINGGGQDDTLNGTDSVAVGAGEVDVLTGGGGNDRFILGDETQAYYTTAGEADFVRITDFATNGDVIQLHGTAADYSLTQVGADVELRYNGELVGILANRTATALDLNAAYFNYVMAVNTAPTGVDDAITTDEDTSVTIAIADLLGNDTDPDTGDTLSLVSFDASGSIGSVTQVGDTLVYTPAATANSLSANETATDSFTYILADSNGEQSSATVNITINGVNDAPTAQGESFTIDEDTSLTVAIADLLSNDSDVDSNDTLALASVGNALNGTVSLDDNGNVIFTPDADFFGDASFEYTISDGQGGEATATVAISVNEVIENTAPTTTGLESFKVTDNAPNTVIDLFSLFSDAEQADEDLTYSLVGNTNNSLFAGITLDAAAGTFTLDYASGAHGSADFTLRATDAEGSFVDTTFTVSVFNATSYGDYITGTAGQDVFRGGRGNDILKGFAGDDILRGNSGHDALYGGEGNDDLRGGEGYDFLSGGDGNDILNGTGTFDKGSWEIDVLLGGAGNDIFVLGDEANAYYTGGYLLDYALIKDFDNQEDTLQLKGAASDYRTYASGSTTYLYKVQKLFWFSTQDLIAVVQGDQVDLHSSAIEFVG